MLCAAISFGAEALPGEARASGSVPSACCESVFVLRPDIVPQQTIKSDRFQHVAHRAADCRLVMALPPQVHGPGDVRFFLQVVPRGVADVLPIGTFWIPTN